MDIRTEGAVCKQNKSSSIYVNMWYDGEFKKTSQRLEYNGGLMRSFRVDPDELSWFLLQSGVNNCKGEKVNIKELYYVTPKLSLEEGLTRISHVSDHEILELLKVVKVGCTVDCYVVLEGQKGLNDVMKSPSRKKLTPVRGSRGNTTLPSSNVSHSQPDTIICSLSSQPPFIETQTSDVQTQLPDTEIQFDDESEEDPEYDPIISGDVCTDESEESLVDEGIIYENNESEECMENEMAESGDDDFEAEMMESDNDTSDGEYIEARNRVKATQAKLIEIANQIQREAAEGKLSSQIPQTTATSVTEADGTGFVSDYEESDDEIHTPVESDDDLDFGRRRRRVKVINENTDFSKLKWKVGIRFETRESFKDAVARFAIAQGRNVAVTISNKSRQQRVGATCIKGCPFKLYGSWDSRLASFVIKTVIDEHTCNRNMGANRQLKSTWVARQLLEVFKAKPHWPATEIIETVRRAYKVIVKKQFAYRVKLNAHRMLHGSMKDHYNKVGRYLEALRSTSPESVFKLEVDSKKEVHPPIFQRFFVCFDGLGNGWIEGCRRVLCVDGCFIKTFLGGMLLSAVGRDANEQMFPVAWAVVEGENNESWEWFLMELKNALHEQSDGESWTIISDEHQGIINAVAKVLPLAEHRHCARHVFANWHKKFKGDELKVLFWKAAKAYNEADYHGALDEMAEVCADAVNGFKAYNPSKFCRAFIRTHTKCDVIVSNMAETFNGYIINARTKHLIHMLEDIRTALMQRLVVKREEMEKKIGLISPKVVAKLELEKEEAANFMPMPSSSDVFQVSHRMDTLTVDLNARSCTCRKWDLNAIPCCHAVSCIFFLNKNAEDYVDSCYWKETYMKAYSGRIKTCDGERHWPRIEFPLSPPPIKIGPGRPRRSRIRDPHENPKKPGKITKHGVEMSCSVCKSKQHNKRTCPDKNKVVETQPKRGRGRPRKERGRVSSEVNQPSLSHHEVTAEPTRTGRGGRVIRGRRVSRGGKRGGRGASGGGRGASGGSKIPQGYGVYVDDHGNSYTNVSGQVQGPRLI